jgi:rhamnosyltransferase
VHPEQLTFLGETMSNRAVCDLSRVAVILTTWNSERFFDMFPEPLLGQGIKPEQVLVVDSESKDRTVEMARSFGFSVYQSPRREFNHGGTRALAATLVPWAEILAYTTPDAIMASPDTLATLVAAFEDPKIGAVYGRQVPHVDADPFACHACAFNYPERSLVRDYDSIKTLGFKAIFFSNNLGAFRRTALEAVGNFPPSIITAEDTCVAAKLMMSGWKTAYVAEAAVRHSHNQTLRQLFRRYFDTGVLHERESWLRENYGEPSGEGMRFVRSEIAWVRKKNPLLVPMVFLRTAAKYFGYRLGRREAMLSRGIKRRMGNFREYWAEHSVGTSEHR